MKNSTTGPPSTVKRVTNPTSKPAPGASTVPRPDPIVSEVEAHGGHLDRSPDVTPTHEAEKFRSFTPPDLTENQRTVWDVADALGRTPPNIDPTYVDVVQRAATFLSDVLLPSPKPSSAPISRPVSTTVGEIETHGGNISSDFLLKNAAMAARNSVIDAMNGINSLISRAKNAGFGPPFNPFVRIAEFNSARGNGPIDVSPQDATDIVTALIAYVELLQGERSGAIDFEHNRATAAQLSSLSLSFEGFGTSGNTAVDLLKFLPDLDALKEQRAREALAVLDFKKRVPRVVFTSDYAPDGKLRGSLVGWRRIADASGYVVRRRSVFTGRVRSFTLSNDQLKTAFDSLLQYISTWVMGFYSSIDVNSVFVFLDGSVEPHDYYIYTIQAYQVTSTVKGNIFSVDTNPFSMSVSQRLSLQKQLETISPGSGGKAVSPWPVIANSLVGRTDYDWVLAGVNVRGSVNRSDTRTETRGYSYLSSQLDFLFGRMDVGKFLLPTDIDAVAANVRASVNRFGVTQVLQEVLEDTGVLFHFEGRDVADDPHFMNIDALDPADSKLITAIASSIDPETATLDMSAFTSNMNSVISSSPAPKLGPSSPIFPSEVEAPDGSADASGVQFINQLGPTQDTHVDLTTFEGVSKLMRAVRIISDAGGSRENVLKGV